ncbi:MAG: TatD family hydrolase, partial [Oscillospiraceae bacterium]
GEIGVDYFYETIPREEQMKAFEQQLGLAKDLDMPVIIHSRDAFDDTLRILKKYRPKGVLHCFSGSKEIAREALKLDMYIGFTGVLTFKNARKAVEAASEIPMDRLLLETDCPYMAPEPFRGKSSVSSMIAFTAQKLGEIKNLDTQTVLDITCKNAMSFYGINE